MRAIDGDRLIDSLESAKRGRGIEVDLVYSLIQEGIRQLPTLSVDDFRPKGRWEPVDARYSRCTNCKKERNVRTQIAWEFFPHCGADMRGGGEDEC